MTWQHSCKSVCDPSLSENSIFDIESTRLTAMSNRRQLTTCYLICPVISFSCSGSIDAYAYELTTLWSPKVEDVQCPFFLKEKTYNVASIFLCLVRFRKQKIRFWCCEKHASYMGFWALPWASSGRLCCMRPKRALVLLPSTSTLRTIK